MTTITAQRGGYNWRAFGAWLAASFVGMAVSMTVAITLMWSVAEAVEPAAGELLAALAAGAVLGLGVGLGTGLLPGLVLRQRLGGLGRWLAGSVLGGVVGGAAVMLLVYNQDGQAPAFLIAVIVALGAAVGLGQWLALRDRVARAGWWVLASALAVGASFVVVMGLGGEGREAFAIGGLALAYGLISASAMGWLLSEGG